ncbi:abortive infection family protein [Alsobacter sp. KACC 23698]|uniref:Abortive infection family protein n=1 Tax=Alsobacter sp. KACC 23698 TaxID=3149229 RepID=A0AAU7J9K8_9HYPH
MTRKPPSEHLFALALDLQEMLVDHVTGGSGNNDAYVSMRKELCSRQGVKSLLPGFVIDSHSLSAVWSWVKPRYGTYAQRRVFIRDVFQPLLKHLEFDYAAPLDQGTSQALKTFDEAGVHAAWEKALSRRAEDPEGAITAARTLLETVCKRIVEELTGSVDDGADLPKLYRQTAERLNLAPTQHTEQVFKSILQSCMTVVKDLGELRNKVGDAHGKVARQVRPAPRHAELAVNLAGSLSAFLVQTFEARNNEKGPQ